MRVHNIVYHMHTRRPPFRDLSPEDYTQRSRDREITAVCNKATRLGLTLWSRLHYRRTSEVSQQVCAGTPDFRFTVRVQ